MIELRTPGDFLPFGRRGFDNANMLMLAYTVCDRFRYRVLSIDATPRFAKDVVFDCPDAAQDTVARELAAHLAAADLRSMFSASDRVRGLVWVDSITLDRPDDPAHVVKFCRNGQVRMSAACDAAEVNDLLRSCVSSRSRRVPLRRSGSPVSSAPLHSFGEWGVRPAV